MALSIKSDEADALARELAAETGESLTQAVTTAIRERLERQRATGRRPLSERLRLLVDEFQALPVLDDRTPDEILGYDENGLPT